MWSQIILSTLNRVSLASIKASKLAISEYDSKLTAREELVISGWANHLWDFLMSPAKLAGKEYYEKAKELNPLRLFERAGVSYLNNLRLMKFKQAMDKMSSENVTFQNNPNAYKQVADVINTFTGRASLGALEPNAKALAAILYSPRNWASLIKTSTPYFLISMYKWRDKGSFKPSYAQKMAVTDYMKYVAFEGAFLTLAAIWANGDDDDETEVSFNPTSSDFMKLRMGNTRMDFFGGRAQYLVWLTRLATDKTTTSSGKEVRLGSTPFAATKFDLNLRMFLNKLSPAASLFVDYTRTKTDVDKRTGEYVRLNPFTGDEYSFMEEVKERSYPMFWGTVADIQKEQPALVEAFMISLAFIGRNSSVYGNEKKEKKSNLSRPTRATVSPNYQVTPNDKP